MAADLLTRVPWGLDDSIWELYGIAGQPASVMITGDDIFVESWYGGLDEDELRAKFDLLASL